METECTVSFMRFGREGSPLALAHATRGLTVPAPSYQPPHGADARRGNYTGWEPYARPHTHSRRPRATHPSTEARVGRMELGDTRAEGARVTVRGAGGMGTRAIRQWRRRAESARTPRAQYDGLRLA